MKSSNPLLTGQALPVSETSPTNEVHAEETGQVPASDIQGNGTPSVTSDPDSGSKKKNEAEGDNTAVRQYGYRALDVTDWRIFIRIGYTYYMKYYKVDSTNRMTPALQPWSTQQLFRDFRGAGRERDIDLIPIFVGMGSFPSHVNYQECVGGMYNTYSRLSYQPAAGEWPTIEKMLRHIFGGQYEFGLDFFQLLYVAPTQPLPILLLISKERQTGKTTLLNLLKEIFGDNATIVNNEALRSNFNAERSGKLLVMCDEAFQNRKEDSERLKALSTAKRTYLEFKGKDRFEIENFAKIVLCSNNVIDPVYIDVEEVRYWVREVPRIEEDNPNILEEMKREIPAFLDYLLHRRLSVPAPLSRMWFRPEDLATPALARIKRICRPTVELDLAEFLLDVMDHFYVDHLQLTNSDLQTLLKIHGRDIRDVHRIICKVWDIPRAANKMAYDLYSDWNNRTCERAYGRYYTFTRSFLEGLVPDYTSDVRSPTLPDPPTPEEGREATYTSLFSD